MNKYIHSDSKKVTLAKYNLTSHFYQFFQAQVPNDNIFASTDSNISVRNTVECDKDYITVGMANNVEIFPRNVTQVLFGYTHF